MSEALGSIVTGVLEGDSRTETRLLGDPMRVAVPETEKQAVAGRDAGLLGLEGQGLVAVEGCEDCFCGAQPGDAWAHAVGGAGPVPGGEAGDGEEGEYGRDLQGFLLWF